MKCSFSDNNRMYNKIHPFDLSVCVVRMYYYIYTYASDTVTSMTSMIETLLPIIYIYPWPSVKQKYKAIIFISLMACSDVVICHSFNAPQISAHTPTTCRIKII